MANEKPHIQICLSTLQIKLVAGALGIITTIVMGLVGLTYSNMADEIHTKANTETVMTMEADIRRELTEIRKLQDQLLKLELQHMGIK